jgi:trimethylamine-N-oxide reductase (cytochrome c)
LGALYSEGCSELDWVKRVFDSSDLPKHVSWREFSKKGYFVVPPEPEATRDPVYFRWYAEDRAKDVPEPHPLPSQYTDELGKGLQTPSGKIEFVATTIARGDPDNPERPALNRYIPAWEGPDSAELFERFPLQLTSSHSRYSFHTYCDGKDSAINDIDEHRVHIDGYDYWVLRMSVDDAAKRGIKRHDLVRVRNDRGAVICAADVSPLLAPGVVKAYQASANFDPIEDGEHVTDRGGCLNILTPRRPQIKGTEGMGSNSCLVEVERWHA